MPDRILDVIPSVYPISRTEIAMRLGDDHELDRLLADLVARGLVIRTADGYRRVKNET